MKLLEINMNCSLSKSLPIVLSNTIGQNDLGKLYESLLGLEIITVVDILKWDSQWHKLIHTLAISMSLTMHSLFLTILLMCLHDSLSGPRVEELLYLLMVLMSSSLEKRAHIVTSLPGISSNRSRSTCWFCVELKDLWRVFHKLSSSMQGQLLY